MLKDVSEELTASTFRVENQKSKKPARSRWLGSFLPPKRRFTYGIHGAISQMTSTFITTAVRTSHLAQPRRNLYKKTSRNKTVKNGGKWGTM
jgi:hypothetical protein